MITTSLFLPDLKAFCTIPIDIFAFPSFYPGRYFVTSHQQAQMGIHLTYMVLINGLLLKLKLSLLSREFLEPLILTTLDNGCFHAVLLSVISSFARIPDGTL